MSDNNELTNEEEITLLEVTDGDTEEMTVDNPNHTTEKPKSQRKSIVYDLEDAEEEEDKDEFSGRDKFRSERSTMFSLKGQESRKNIPDTLNVDRARREFGIHATNKNNQNFIGRRKQKNKNKNFRLFSGSPMARSGPVSDLRQFIHTTRNSSHSRIPHNLLMSGLGLNSVQNYVITIDLILLNIIIALFRQQMKLGILNPIVAQNQLLMSALLGQNPTNPLLTPLQVNGQNLLGAVDGIHKKKLDDIQITIKNREVSPNVNTLQTKSRIRCLVPRDDSMTETSDCELIEGMPSVPENKEIRQPKNKTPFKTLFAKHLETKATQPKVEKKVENNLFGEAFAEVEAGVDNDYLKRMEEMKKKREEILRKKEEARLAMADQRMEAAMKLKEKIHM